LTWMLSRQRIPAAQAPRLLPTESRITQMTQAGGDGDETALVEILCDELDVDNGFDCINVEVTVGTDAVEASVLVLGFCAHYEPVTHGYAEVVT